MSVCGQTIQSPSPVLSSHGVFGVRVDSAIVVSIVAKRIDDQFVVLDLEVQWLARDPVDRCVLEPLAHELVKALRPLFVGLCGNDGMQWRVSQHHDRQA